MSNRYATLVILAEDERSANLLRRYVQRALHLDNRRIRQEISPSAQGDAKQWVLSRYAIEVRATRNKLSKKGLLVHLDADKDLVVKRAAQLAAILKADGQIERGAAEPISHAIPRRQTETWLCVLTGITVDEEQDCKRLQLARDFDQLVPNAAKALFDLTRPNANPPALPSLATSIPELRRLEP